MFGRMRRYKFPQRKRDFLRLADNLSKALLKTVFVLLVLVLLMQMALQNDFIRSNLASADRWEGTRLN
ncbi:MULTISPECIES: hypothetical protein [unclassified Paenibacillus]|uniref:hypothetical protein n=1 Tax=unclassified Paenibacillus TaxID=185978 RepID=UPI0036D21746